MSQAYCIICGRRKNIDKFTIIEPNQKGDCGIQDRRTGKTILPSNIGTCNTCHFAYSQGEKRGD